jgi:hypothetical protein
MTPSTKTIATLHHFHPLVEVDTFVDDFNPKMDLVLVREAFIYALMHSSRLSFDSPLNMVSKLLQYCFVFNDFANGFDFCFEICWHIVHDHVLPSVSHMFVTT